MRSFLVWDKVNKKEVYRTDNKHEANKHLCSAKSVYEISGRKGSQIKRRLLELVKSLETNKPIPLYSTEVKQKTITRKRTAEHNEKISRAMSGKSKSSDHCNAISEAMVGNENRR